MGIGYSRSNQISGGGIIVADRSVDNRWDIPEGSPKLTVDAFFQHDISRSDRKPRPRTDRRALGLRGRMPHSRRPDGFAGGLTEQGLILEYQTHFDDPKEQEAEKPSDQSKLDERRPALLFSSFL